MKQVFYTSLTACFFAVTAFGQKQPSKKFVYYEGKPGITKRVSELQFMTLQKATPKPLNTFDESLEFRLDEVKKFKEGLKKESLQKTIPKLPDSAADMSMAMEELSNPSTQNIWSNFLATTFDEFPNVAPPDPNGAVGPSQIVTLTNNMLKVFEKKAVTDAPVVSSKGTLQTPVRAQFSMPTYTFFSALLPEGSYSSDPHVRYDRLSKRWFIVAIEKNSSLQNNAVLLAVSDGERLTDESSFIFYSFPSALLPNNSGAVPPFFDYPRLGVDNNELLIGGNDIFFTDTPFGPARDSIHSVGFVIDKKKLLHGQLTLFALQLGRVIDAATGSGIIIPQGVYNDDPTAPKSFFAGVNFKPDGLPSDGLVITSLTFDAKGQLVDTSEMNVPVLPFQFPRQITALGSPMPIDPLDGRLLEASIYKNKLNKKFNLWTAHAIGVNQSGSFVTSDVFVQEARTGARWYQIADIYRKPHVSQSGTVYDSTQASGRRAIQYFNPSIAANGQGQAVLGGTTAAYNRHLNAFIAGRYYEDANGTLSPPQKATATQALYALSFPEVGYVDRWGDYSQTIVDPMDNQTIWSFQEYATSDDNFGVRAIQIKAPPPATPLPVDPIPNTANIWVTVKGVSVDHSGFFDPGSDAGGPGYNRLSVKATGNLLISHLRFDNPIQIRFIVNARGKPAGKYTIVITNPDGQLVTTDLRITTPAAKTLLVNNNALQSEIGKYCTASNVVPNPTSGEFKLQINAAKDWNARVVLLDISGKQISESHNNLVKGMNELPLSVAAYNKGAYLAAVYNENDVLITVQKIVKQ